MTDNHPTVSTLPRWSVGDVHESMTARSFVDAMERLGADVARVEALFEQHGVRAQPGDTAVTDEHGAAADEVITAFNEVLHQHMLLEVYVYATVSTDSRHEQAQSLMSELQVLEARLTPLLARLAEWVRSLGPGSLAARSQVAHDHEGPLLRLAERAEHQMAEAEEALYAELATTGSTAWSRLQSDVTSQLTAEVQMPGGSVERLPMPAVRGLATHLDPAVRRAAYEAEMLAWPNVAVSCAAALNGVKGEAVTVDRRRGWASPLDAALFANSVSRPTFDAMRTAIEESLPDFRRWMRTKARLHGHDGGLPWWDLVAPLPLSAAGITWEDGMGVVRDAFATFSPALAGLVDRALDEGWIDAEPRDGKTGGAFCMPFVDDRSLVLLNWAGSADSAQTAAHELGHAYHNTQLAHRTALQRRLPMALAETASIFCETLVVEAGLARLSGPERLAQLDVDLVGTNQVVVDIHSRFTFETEVFARRQRRTLGVNELDEMMLDAQEGAYGVGLDLDTRHRHMWVLKPHYYASHFYNWPYTYGLLFGLGLYARFREDPERFGAGYDDLLSRAGMATAEELGDAFGLDVADVGFWTASLDVVRTRIADYESLANEVLAGGPPGARG
ncbi:MAG: M3 family oligoendopeptidase [Actinomycetota bacterium]|nr:MAG: M3 family oligoendopeptidase [Actinomycetota bacterium]